ncbi:MULTISPECIES: hypothetical protein [Mumia]|nr:MULTISPECIES: hypothetical protein [unclassified Mumia]
MKWRFAHRKGDIGMFEHAAMQEASLTATPIGQAVDEAKALV